MNEFNEYNEFIPVFNEYRDVDFFLTGTRVYGPATIQSDIDVVMGAEDAVRLLDSLRISGIPLWEAKSIDPEYPSYCFAIPFFGVVNIIIPFDEADFVSWYKATEYMKTIPPIEDKEERIEVFKKARAL